MVEDKPTIRKKKLTRFDYQRIINIMLYGENFDPMQGIQSKRKPDSYYRSGYTSGKEQKEKEE